MVRSPPLYSGNSGLTASSRRRMMVCREVPTSRETALILAPAFRCSSAARRCSWFSAGGRPNRLPAALALASFRLKMTCPVSPRMPPSVFFTAHLPAWQSGCFLFIHYIDFRTQPDHTIMAILFMAHCGCQCISFFSVGCSLITRLIYLCVLLN